MIENFPNLGKELDIQIQETQKFPNIMKPKMLTPRYIMIKVSKLKDKEKILKSVGEKQLATYKGTPRKLSVNFSPETTQARRKWDGIFKVWKEKLNKTKNCQPRVLYLAKLSYKNEEEIKTWLDNQKLRDYITSRPA